MARGDDEPEKKIILGLIILTGIGVIVGIIISLISYFNNKEASNSLNKKFDNVHKKLNSLHTKLNSLSTV